MFRLLFAALVAAVTLPSHAGDSISSAQVIYGHNAQAVVFDDVTARSVVGRGATSYLSAGQPATGYQAAVLPFFDINRYLSDQQQLGIALNQTAAQTAGNVARIAERVAELQQGERTATARADAAERVLRAAGLSAPETPPAYLIVQQNGVPVVQQLTTPQVQALTAQTMPREAEVAEGDIAPDAGTGSLLGQYCGKCHGIDNAEPSGGLYLDYSAEFAASINDRLADVLFSIDSGEMPKGEAALDNATRNDLKNEILQFLYSTRKGR